MLKKRKRPTRRKRISKRGGVRKSVFISCEQLDAVDEIREYYKSELKESITLAYMIREGLRKQITHMRNELAKAKKGSYHAKKRKHTK